MPKEDFLTKQIEKLGQAIAALIDLRRKGKPTESLQIAQTTVNELFDGKFEQVRDANINDFAQMVEHQHFNRQQIDALAQIMEETGIVYEDLEKPHEAHGFFEKSLFFYKKLNEIDKTFSFEREAIIADLQYKINL